MLGDHDVSELSARYHIEIKEPICAPNAPAPGPELMTER
jgi:hypothetical protein